MRQSQMEGQGLSDADSGMRRNIVAWGVLWGLPTPQEDAGLGLRGGQVWALSCLLSVTLSREGSPGQVLLTLHPSLS
jgi:hypothetical protein